MRCRALHRKVKIWDKFALIIRSPPKGCQLCHIGAKLVLFITGLCAEKCFYCPLSSERRGRDVIYANERKITSVEEAFEEAHRMKALGTGVTGGDPLVKLDRTLSYIKALKNEFGDDHHIHLYTTPKLLTLEKVRKLEKAGLDELRIHPPLPLSSGALDSIKWVPRETSMDVGIEVPAIPGMLDTLITITEFAEEHDFLFVNLNELEMCDENAFQLMARGMELAGEDTSAVKGSREVSISLLNWASENTSRITVHFCPVKVKERMQMRNRFIRTAMSISKPYEYVTEEGIIEYAIVKGNLDEIKEFLEENHVPENMYEVDVEKQAILTSPEIALTLRKYVENIECYVEGVYPDYYRTVVYRYELCPSG
ncbi:radical SAM protein [archaeon]|nr:MAG: radical SAM protein [archaeon]RLG65414.1 MAG: radical SAM protein [archaeon]RLG66505.1 MAG: radical SAM protein [archaeon]HDM24217.1 radical SAM protein [Candidatus Bathyarchaeota archaeon]